MLPLPKAGGEPPAGSTRRVSFEESLIAGSAEFEAERLRALRAPQLETKPDNVDKTQIEVIPEGLVPNQANESSSSESKKVEPEGNPESKVAIKGKAAKAKPRQEYYEEEYYEEYDEYAEDYEYEAPVQGKAAGKGKKSKSKPRYDPYSGYYFDPMGHAVKGKGKRLPKRAPWADAYDEESDYLYS